MEVLFITIPVLLHAIAMVNRYKHTNGTKLPMLVEGVLTPVRVTQVGDSFMLPMCGQSCHVLRLVQTIDQLCEVIGFVFLCNFCRLNVGGSTVWLSQVLAEPLVAARF